MDIIELKQTILEDNDADADLLREELNRNKTCLLNLMSSPGSGKTTTLLALDRYFKDKIRWGVMEADIDGDVDACTLQEAGIPAIQLHTGGMCHLDADMTRQGLRSFNRDDLDLVVLENIGNLVCPAEFDTGAHINMTILSVPEGDDKPVKYPLMYEVSDIMAVNKTDALEVFDFNKDTVIAAAKKRNPNVKIFFISALSGDGVKELAEELLLRIREINNGENKNYYNK